MRNTITKGMLSQRVYPGLQGRISASARLQYRRHWLARHSANHAPPKLCGLLRKLSVKIDRSPLRVIGINVREVADPVEGALGRAKRPWLPAKRSSVDIPYLAPASKIHMVFGSANTKDALSSLKMVWALFLLRAVRARCKRFPGRVRQGCHSTPSQAHIFTSTELIRRAKGISTARSQFQISGGQIE